MIRLNYHQQENWRRAVRLNADMIRAYGFGYLRSLYLSVRGGQTYGMHSGYSP